MSLADLLERDANGVLSLPAYTYPGGYPLLYLDGYHEPLCADCATKAYLTEDVDISDLKDKPHVCTIFYEGESEHCWKCDAEIPSYAVLQRESMEWVDRIE